MAAQRPDRSASIAQAKELAQAGRFEDAYDLLSAHADLDAAPDGAAVRDRVRRGLLDALAARFPTHDVLLRSAPVSNLKSLPLSSRDVFLLGLFRDALALRDALAISPLDEVDNLRGIAKLIDLGLVKAD